MPLALLSILTQNLCNNSALFENCTRAISLKPKIFCISSEIYYSWISMVVNVGRSITWKRFSWKFLQRYQANNSQQKWEALHEKVEVISNACENWRLGKVIESEQMSCFWIIRFPMNCLTKTKPIYTIWAFLKELRIFARLSENIKDCKLKCTGKYFMH